jgi:uncharacterized membrane protein
MDTKRIDRWILGLVIGLVVIGGVMAVLAYTSGALDTIAEWKGRAEAFATERGIARGDFPDSGLPFGGTMAGRLSHRGPGLSHRGPSPIGALFVIGGVLLLARHMRRRHHQLHTALAGTEASDASAEDVLRNRFADGEISADEYQRRMNVLHDTNSDQKEKK